MTEFKKALAAVDEFETLTDSAGDSVSLELLLRLETLIRDTGPNVEKLRRKASETDPTKQLFGPQMCQKVRDLASRWDTLNERAASILRQGEPRLRVARESPAAAPPSHSYMSTQSQTPQFSIASSVLSPSALDAAASRSSTVQAAPSLVPRRELAARAAEMRMGSSSPSALAAATSSVAPTPSAPPSVSKSAVAPQSVTQPASRAVVHMDELLHLVHRVFLSHGFCVTDRVSANIDGHFEMTSADTVVERGNNAGHIQVSYTKEIEGQPLAVRALFVPVQRHLVVYASANCGSSCDFQTRVALQLGMAAVSVHAKTDYLLVYPLVYRQCLPALPSLPPEVCFSLLSLFAIPALGKIACASRALSQSVMKDDLLWWSVLLALPLTDFLRATVHSLEDERRAGRPLPEGECRRIVRAEVERIREDEARRRHARQMEEQMRRENPLMVGRPQRGGRPFPGGPFGPFGGGGVIGGDYDIMPGGGFGGGFGNDRRGPFGGGFGGRFGGLM